MDQREQGARFFDEQTFPNVDRRSTWLTHLLPRLQAFEEQVIANARRSAALLLEAQAENGNHRRENDKLKAAVRQLQQRVLRLSEALGPQSREDAESELVDLSGETDSVTDSVSDGTLNRTHLLPDAAEVVNHLAESEDSNQGETEHGGVAEINVLDPFSSSAAILPYDGNPTTPFGQWRERVTDALLLLSNLDETQKLGRVRIALKVGPDSASWNCSRLPPQLTMH